VAAPWIADASLADGAGKVRCPLHAARPVHGAYRSLRAYR
jgi:hypothetical protein